MGTELKVAVVGPTGSAGLELTRLLFQHPRLKPPLLLWHETGGTIVPRSVSQLLPELKLNGEGTVHPFSWHAVHCAGVDLLFLPMPEEMSRALAAEAAAHGVLAIDLSAALKRRSRKQAQSAVADAVRTMNSAYGWETGEGLS